MFFLSPNASFKLGHCVSTRKHLICQLHTRSEFHRELKTMTRNTRQQHSRFSKTSLFLVKGVLLSSVSSCVQEAHRSWRAALPRSRTSPAWTSLTTVPWMSPPPAKLIKISFFVLFFFHVGLCFLSGYLQGWTLTCPRCWCGWQRTDRSGTSRWAKTSTTSSPSKVKKIKWVSTHQEETLACRSAETRWFID